ncbi:hypothetical protein ACH40E_41370 [Streptomyces acidicola]
MTTFALVGAGPGLGLATARRFGKRGTASCSSLHTDCDGFRHYAEPMPD